jgi:hypothetical protein
MPPRVPDILRERFEILDPNNVRVNFQDQVVRDLPLRLLSDEAQRRGGRLDDRAENVFDLDRVSVEERSIPPNSRYSYSSTRQTPPTNLQWVSRRSAAATTARAIPYCSRPRMGISWRPASTRRSATGSSRLTVGGRPSRAVSPGSASRYARTRSPAAGRGTAPGSNTSPASHGTAAAAG